MVDEIVLSNNLTPARSEAHDLKGEKKFELSEGLRLKIKSGHQEEDLFNQKVPDGKHWIVDLVINISESDV